MVPATPIDLHALLATIYVNGDDGYKWAKCDRCEALLMEIDAGTFMNEVADKALAHAPECPNPLPSHEGSGPACPRCGARFVIWRMARLPWRKGQLWRCYGCFNRWRDDEYLPSAS